MKHSSSIKKVVILGSGALKIGEAGEFDYSGSQALKALKEEGIHTIVINPNIATIQTSQELADTIYLLPITPYFVEEVIKKEQPDGILVAFGGQTALNCAMELHQHKIFEKYQVEVLGTPISTIIETENRNLFIEKLQEIKVKTAKSQAANSVQEAMQVAKGVGFPVMVRSAFVLGGLGSGMARNEEELLEIVQKSFTFTSQVLIEESLQGWKEIEFEILRDVQNNCIAVCNMENFDPIGIHTGESIVVAPSQTLTDQENQMLRKVALETVQHLKIVGECNIQFALHPHSLEFRVIEVNARLSRSSALASKATGYPLAFIAAKLALGYPLYELKNSVTQTTTAFFEPALDYVVVKLPRWDLGKFYGVSRTIDSTMKSVGEVMAIGRNFEEALQKGIRMLDFGYLGFETHRFSQPSSTWIKENLSKPNDERLYIIATAFQQGFSIEEIHQLTQIDVWFLQRLYRIFEMEQALKLYKENWPSIPIELFKMAKQLGFADAQIASILLGKENLWDNEWKIRQWRKEKGIIPVVKQIDTLAAEFPAHTNYLYLTYSGTENDIAPEANTSIAVLGSGAYRIGSSVEFDWCCVNALNFAKEWGYKTLVINYNPETVSTDYDVSDQLYFEELSWERIGDILEFEKPWATLLSTGGQIPNTLALRLKQAGFPILGTLPENIDKAENRQSFSQTMDQLGMLQPRWKEVHSFSTLQEFILEVGFPVLIRPSYVLSGTAMNVISNEEELEKMRNWLQNMSPKYPIVVSEFIENAQEIEFDAVAKNGKILVFALSEHIEWAGVHSGDSTMFSPPQKITVETTMKIRKMAEKIADMYAITGPFNIQFLKKNDAILVIELNLRASRSFPFVSKIYHENLIKIAMEACLDSTSTTSFPIQWDKMKYVGVKASQFSFTRMEEADPVLSVEMSSTGEVGCLGFTAEEALLKSLLSVGYVLPEKGVLISSGPYESKLRLLESCKILATKGLKLYATDGTFQFLKDNNIAAEKVEWPDGKEGHNGLHVLKERKVDLVINIPKNLSPSELDNDYTLRRTAVDYNIPLMTNAQLVSAFIEAFSRYSLQDLKIMSLQEYYNL